MPFAVPIAIAASTAISAGLAARQASQAKKAAAPLMAAQTQLAQQQAAIAKLAGPAFTETSDYYRQLLHGNRAAMTTALAPEITSITELARGAERGLDRGPAGPQRDVAKAELGRQKVGQIGSLFPQARAAGAAGLTNLGSLAMGGAGNAANIYQSLLSGQRADRQFQAEEQGQLGEGLGSLLTDFYKAWQQQGTKGVGASGAGKGDWTTSSWGKSWGGWNN